MLASCIDESKWVSVKQSISYEAERHLTSFNFPLIDRTFASSTLRCEK